MKRHIVIAGQRQVGKSTLVNRLLTDCDKPVYGFRTAMGGSLKDGYRSFFIHPADCLEKIESSYNRIGESNGIERKFYADVFDNLGVKYLDVRPDGIIIMDELGFMENEAEIFKAKVLECLDGNIPIIATAKAGIDSEFLSRIINHPNADVYYIDEENRDQLYEEIKKFWNVFIGD